MATKAPTRSPDILSEITPSLTEALQPGRVSKITIAITDHRDAAELGPQAAQQLAQALATGTEWAGHTLPARKVLFTGENTPFLLHTDPQSANLVTWTPRRAKECTWNGDRRSDQVARLIEWRERLAGSRPDVVIINDPLAFFGGDVGFWSHRMRQFAEEAADYKTAIVFALYKSLPLLNGLLPDHLRPSRILSTIARGTHAGFVLSGACNQFTLTPERRLYVSPARKAA